jgi:hypothetical protein
MKTLKEWCIGEGAGTDEGIYFNIGQTPVKKRKAKPFLR